MVIPLHRHASDEGAEVAGCDPWAVRCPGLGSGRTLRRDGTDDL